MIADETADDNHHRANNKHVIAPRLYFRQIKPRSHRQNNKADD